MDPNATSQYWTSAPIEFEQCDLNQELASQCNVQYTASQEQCDGKLSFNSLLNHFFPNEIFESVMNYFILPEKFDVTRFHINTCNGNLEFFSEAREDIDLIPNRLRVSDATLSLTIMYKVQSIYYAIISFEMNGFVHIENRRLEIVAVKSFGNDPLSITIKVNQISAKDFCKLFSVLEFTSPNPPPSVEELKAVSLSNAVIEGTYNIEGCFEFVLTGKPDTSDVFQQSQVYLIIQKPCNEQVSAAMSVYFASSASFHHLLSGILGKDVALRIPFLWFQKLNLALQSSTAGIAKIKNENFNRVFRFFVTRGMAVNTGLTISIEFPMQEYTRQVAPDIPAMSVPIKALFIARIFGAKINIVFETDLEMSLGYSLLMFMSKAKATSMATTLQRIDTPVKVNRMEVLLTKRLVIVYITVTSSFSMVHGLVPVKDFQMQLQKSIKYGWQIIGQGTGDISSTLFKTKIKKEQNNTYKFVGKTEQISSYALVESFAKDSGIMEIFNSFSFLKFEIRDVLVSSRVASKLGFRIVGKPLIFNYDVTQYCEGFVYNNTRNRPGFALGIIVKRIKFDDLLVKMYGPREQRATWLRNVDCGILISNDNENENSKNISFAFIELNEFTLKRGISIILRVYIPQNCEGDGLCMLLQGSEGIKASKGILFKGDVTTSSGLTLEWQVSSFRLSQNVELKDVVFRISGKKKISMVMLGRIEVQGLSVTGSIASDVTGGVLVEMSMDAIMHKPFGVKAVAFGEMMYKSTMSTDSTVSTFDLQGKMFLGTVHLDQRIITEASLSMNIVDAKQSFFYSKISPFDLTTFLEAFGFDSKISTILQQTQFIEPTIASYSNNPLGTTLQDMNLEIQNRLTIQGLIFVLGVYGEYTIFIQTQEDPTVEMVIRLPKLEFAKGMVKMYAATFMQTSLLYSGPHLIAEITKTSVTMRLQGMVKTLGVSANVNMSVTDAGFNFQLSGSILGVFNADVNATAAFANPKDANFRVNISYL
eukprot:gene6761-7521_t